MGYHFFEDPTMGIILAAIVEVILLISWMFMRENFRKLLLLIGLGIAGLFLGLDFLIQTNSEQLKNATKQIIEAVELEQPSKVIALISDQCLINNFLNKPAAEGIIKYHLAGPVIQSNTITELLVIQAGDQKGRVEVSVLTVFDSSGTYSMVPLLKTRWQMDYTRDPDEKYRITNIAMTKIGDQKGINVWKKSKLNAEW